MSDTSPKSIEQLKAELAQIQNERAELHLKVAARLGAPAEHKGSIDGAKVWWFVGALAAALSAFGSFAIYAAHNPPEVQASAHAMPSSPEVAPVEAVEAEAAEPELAAREPSFEAEVEAAEEEAQQAVEAQAAQASARPPRTPRERPPYREPRETSLGACAGSTDPLCGL